MSQRDDDQDPAVFSPGMPRLGWTVVIPVKPAADGKSRLRLPPAHRHAIVRAIALDTIEAAAACDRVARVRVVTADEPLLAAVASHDGVDVVRDSASGLGAAIELGLAVTGTDLARAVLLGDLPALKPRELSDALSLAARHDLAFVPDADGAGTVLATARAGVPFRPLFGVNSAAAHRRAGFSELRLPEGWGLRRDLDTAAHLPALRRAGLGPHTATLLGAGGSVTPE
jgi:2-phospho-L-lactate guanylyltransferase